MRTASFDCGADAMKYACSIAASIKATVSTDFVSGRMEIETLYVHTVYICDADSDAEAQADAYMVAYQRWPSEDGYHGHTTAILVIPD